MKIINKITFEWFFFLFFAFLIFWQHLINPPFSLADDGYSITLGKLIISDVSLSSWKEHLIESDIGRFRPIYLFYFSFIYLLFGSQPIGLWLGQTIVLWLTLVFIYKIILYLTQNKYLSYVLSLIWLVMPSVAENIFRAGTAEPRQLLFILIVVYLTISLKKFTLQNVALIFLSFLLAVGTKETSILLLPFLAYHFLLTYYPKTNRLLLFFLIMIGLPALLIGSFLLVKYYLPTGYAIENFSINISDIVHSSVNVIRTFQHYILILSFLIFSFFLRLVISIVNSQFLNRINKSTISFSFLILLLQSLFFTIAWKFQFERYFYLTWSFIILFLAIELSEWNDISKNYKIYLKKFTVNYFFFLFCCCSLYITITYKLLVEKNLIKLVFIPFESIAVYKMSYDATQISNSIILWLLNDMNVEEVYLTNDGYEIMYEVGLYASQFKDRSVFVFAPNPDLPRAQFSNGYRYVENPVLEYQNSKNANKILIGIQKDKTTFPELANISNISDIEPNIKYNVVDPKSHWWILKEKNND